MTILQHNREYERIAATLNYVAGRWWWVNLGQRLLGWLAASIALLLAFGLLASLVNLPSSLRWGMLIVLVVGPVVGLVGAVVWPLRRRLTPEQAARQIEEELGGARPKVAGPGTGRLAGGNPLENRFINAVQLATRGSLFDPELIRRALDEIARSTSDLPVDRAVNTRTLKVCGLIALLAGTLLGLAGTLGRERLVFGLGRIWRPASQSWTGLVRIDKVRCLVGAAEYPPDVTVLAGSLLTVEADVSSSADFAREPEARLWTRAVTGSAAPGPVADDGALWRGRDYAPLTMRTARSLVGGRLGRYFFNFPSADKSFSYYLSVGDTNTRDQPFQVVVVQKPQVGSLKVKLAYPDYLRHEQPTADLTEGSFEAPLGAGATITVRMNRPITSAELSLAAPPGEGPGDSLSADAPRAVSMSLAESGLSEVSRLTWQGQLLVSRTTQYRLVFRDQGVITGAWPAGADNDSPKPPSSNFFDLKARPDNPPTVTFARPGQDSFVKPGGAADLVFQAGDDHGLTELKLMTARVAPGATADEAGQLKTDPPEAIQTWTTKDLTDENGLPRRNPKITYAFRADKLAKGDRIVYWVEAKDNRDLTRKAKLLGLTDDGGLQTAASGRFVLTVQDPAELAEMHKKLLERLLAELTGLLNEQKEVRARTVGLGHDAPSSRPATDGESRGQAARAVKAGQAAFADHLLRLAKGLIVAFDAQTKPIQTALLVLAYNESADARQLADALESRLAAAEPKAAADDAVRSLVAKQDRIIYALESLLGLLGQAQKRSEEAGARPDGADLPPEAQAQWRQLADDLQKFIEQQKKDIAVAQSLAKKPVDEFSQDDLEKLKELTANQEKWENFLEQKVSDFSKLAEQDFSNPVLLKELIEIKDDVVMAKDALAKKAVEIAVPLEEAGLELAEALTAHIEKWLPDTPDRIKWSMEEPTEQTDAPMAELPKELEDLVGDLLEQEEDLFDEMDDVTSKWTDSLDKGAGWDALDGPISNMSAQGVTGNQLPNTSEISGRSGEGRTGKSGGEMVEEEATGKGGRRTPTRLSGDPFQKGQVKDSSKEPPGGATGGGKLSGVSGEGLEGPVPAELQKQLQRLATRQASIRNKAEAVDARFRANNFNNFSLEKAITVMRQTELDLGNYRYQNALRRKAVLVNNLAAQQLLLRGEIQVQADRAPQLPDFIRHDVRDIRDADLPARYKDLARRYLQSLGEAGGPVRTSGPTTQPN